MRTPFKLAFKLLAAVGLGSFASLAAAGIPGAIISYGPLGTAAAIPTISGSLLVALAVLLMLVAFRLLKDRPRSGTNLLIAVAAIAAIASGAGGIKLVADAQARISVLEMSDSGGGTLFVPGDGNTYQVFNGTSVTQKIKNIESNCLNGGGNGGEVQPTVQALNGGQSVGTCSTSSTLAPDTQYCDISVNCNPG